MISWFPNCAIVKCSLYRYDMRAFNTQNLANTAYAYAALNLPGARNILPIVSVHLADRLAECRPQELVMVLWWGGGLYSC